MKKRFTIVLIALSACFIGFGQTAPDFSFTDINNETHTLSEALNDGKVILLDFFFVDCPPCNTWGPEIDQIAADFEGTNLEVWALSDRDTDAYISSSVFNPTHSNHKVAGSEGGGNDVINLFADNFTFTGFPTYSVICSDGSIVWDLWPLTPGVSEIRDQLTASCGIQSVGTYNIEELSSISAYPNPATDNVTIEFNLEQSTTMSFDLFNTLGQRLQNIPVETYSAGKQTISLDVSNLVAGLYNVRVQSTEGLQSIDIVVK